MLINEFTVGYLSAFKEISVCYCSTMSKSIWIWGFTSTAILPKIGWSELSNLILFVFKNRNRPFLRSMRRNLMRWLHQRLNLFNKLGWAMASNIFIICLISIANVWVSIVLVVFFFKVSFTKISRVLDILRRSLVKRRDSIGQIIFIRKLFWRWLTQRLLKLRVCLRIVLLIFLLFHYFITIKFNVI